MKLFIFPKLTSFFLLPHCMLVLSIEMNEYKHAVDDYERPIMYLRAAHIDEIENRAEETRELLNGAKKPLSRKRKLRLKLNNLEAESFYIDRDGKKFNM